MIRKNKLLKEAERLDLNLIVTMVFLICFGLVMIYSASVYKINLAQNSGAGYYVKKQLIYAILGAIAVFILHNLAIPDVFYMGSIFLYPTSLIMTLLLPLIGREKYGAKRWITLGIVSLQVAEVVKVGVILMLAMILEKSKRKGKKCDYKVLWLVGFLPAVGILIFSKDLGSAIVIAGIAFGMSYVYTDHKVAHRRLFSSVILVGIGCVLYVKATLPTESHIKEKHHVYQRIAAWINKDGYLNTVSSQLRESQYAIARGGFFGKGLGCSIQKISRIPEVHTDMILAVVGEELGVCGLALYMILILYMVYLILRVARAEDSLFMSAVSTGVAVHIFLQSFINMAVILGAIPNTGITAPFMSSGGTSLVFFMMEVGMVLCGEKQRNRREIKGHMK